MSLTQHKHQTCGISYAAVIKIKPDQSAFSYHMSCRLSVLSGHRRSAHQPGKESAHLSPALCGVLLWLDAICCTRQQAEFQHFFG